MDYIVEIVVALLALAGTLAGSFLAHRKSTAIIEYRLKQLEEKQDKNNNVIERTFKLEEKEAVLEERLKTANRRIEDLEKFHNPH